MKISKKFDRNIPLSEDQLDEYIWERLRLNDLDHDDDAIEEFYARYRKRQKEDPLKLKLEWIEWNSPVYQ